MNVFEQNKLKEIVLYILNKTGGIDFYHVFKILYFAEKSHLAQWGHRITSDDFCALEYGPVPTRLYDAVKGNNPPHTHLADILCKSVHFAGIDAPNVLMTDEIANLDYISESEREALDKSIAENSNLTFRQLKEKSHDAAWEEAYNCKNGTNVLSPLSMAQSANATSATLEYIKEQIDIESALS